MASNLRQIINENKELLQKFAISRPYQTFNQEDLCKTPIEKAAAIIESVIKNHPFLDGNKRTGYVLMRLILIEVYSTKSTSPFRYSPSGW